MRALLGGDSTAPHRNLFGQLLDARPDTREVALVAAPQRRDPFVKDAARTVAAVLPQVLCCRHDLREKKTRREVVCMDHQVQGDNDGLTVLFFYFNFRVPACSPAVVPIEPALPATRK